MRHVKMMHKLFTTPTLVAMVLWCFAGTHSSQAQTLDLGGFAGGSYYLGDINPDQHFAGTQLAYGLLARINTSDRLSFRIGVTQGRLEADDMNFMDKGKLPMPAFTPTNPLTERDKYISRGLNFTTTVTEIAITTEINFLPYFVGSERHRWTPYIFGGASMFMFKPEQIGSKLSLKDFGTEGQLQSTSKKKEYSTTAFAIPFGVGVKFSLGRRLGLGVEWGMRKTFTDYIDDISSTYVYDMYGYDPVANVYYAPNPDDPSQIVAIPITNEVLLSDPTFSHKKGQKRGREYNTDWYSFYGITLTYSIDLQRNKDCRNFNKRR